MEQLKVSPQPKYSLTLQSHTSTAPAYFVISCLDAPVTIGRAMNAKIKLTSKNPKKQSTISRKHAVLSYKGSCWFLEDQNSFNGTLVNGKKVRTTRLHEGDVIVFGVAKSMAYGETKDLSNTDKEFAYRFTSSSQVKRSRSQSLVRNVKRLKSSSNHRRLSNSSLHSTGEPTSTSPASNPMNMEDLDETTEVECTNGKLSTKNHEIQQLKAKLQKQFEEQEKQRKESEMRKQLLDAQQEQIKQEQEKLKKERQEQEKLRQEQEKFQTERKQNEDRLRQEQERLEKAKQELAAQREKEMQQKEDRLRQEQKEQQEQENLRRQQEEKFQSEKQKFEEEKKKLELERQEEALRKAAEHKNQVETKEKIADEFTCTICLQVLLDPHMLLCTHSFCLSCIEDWLQKTDECPICRVCVMSPFLQSAPHSLRGAIDLLTLDDEDREERQKRKHLANKLKKKRAKKASIIQRKIRESLQSDQKLLDVREPWSHRHILFMYDSLSRYSGSNRWLYAGTTGLTKDYIQSASREMLRIAARNLSIAFPDDSFLDSSTKEPVDLASKELRRRILLYLTVGCLKYATKPTSEPVL